MSGIAASINISGNVRPAANACWIVAKAASALSAISGCMDQLRRTVASMVRFVTLSSTTRTGIPRNCAAFTGSASWCMSSSVGSAKRAVK